MFFFLDFLHSFSPAESGFLFMWGLALLGAAAFFIALERWLNLLKCADVDAPVFAKKIRELVGENKKEEALRLCQSGGKRALAQIIGAGIEKSMTIDRDPKFAMRERFLNIIPSMDKRVDLVLTFGNVATMLGLMGTIYGLIVSFAAVGQPDVTPVEKTAMLASGISAAMNTTLFGLIISIPCVTIYTMLRSKIDGIVTDLDRYVLSMLKVLAPAYRIAQDYKISTWRIKSEEDTEPNIGPMMSLIVILIPLLLTSAEFIKVGSIELKLPDASAQEEKLDEPEEEEVEILSLGLNLTVTGKGFNLAHHFREETSEAEGEEEFTPGAVDIPLLNGKYDFETLKKELSEIKRKTLFELLSGKYSGIPPGSTLVQLYSTYTKNLKALQEVKNFSDHESIQISAENAVKYQTLVSTMDAARNQRVHLGKITMFPNVSLAMGVSE